MRNCNGRTSDIGSEGMDKKTPLFSLVEPSEMQELVSLPQPVSLEPGQVLFRENTAGDGMWILDEGAEVSISQTRGKRPVVIANNRGGVSVGAMPLVNRGSPFGTTVVRPGGPVPFSPSAQLVPPPDGTR